jgi:hypothetical protein
MESMFEFGTFFFFFFFFLKWYSLEKKSRHVKVKVYIKCKTILESLKAIFIPPPL